MYVAYGDQMVQLTRRLHQQWDKKQEILSSTQVRMVAMGFVLCMGLHHTRYDTLEALQHEYSSSGYIQGTLSG